MQERFSASPEARLAEPHKIKLGGNVQNYHTKAETEHHFNCFRSEVQVEIQFLLVAFAVCPAVDFFLVYVFTVVGADRERGFRLK